MRNPAPLQRGPQRRAAREVAPALLLGVGVVGEGRGHRHLLRPGLDQAEVLAHGQQLGDDRRVAGDEAAAVAGEVGALRQRVDGEDAVVGVTADVGVQHRDRRSASQAHSR